MLLSVLILNFNTPEKTKNCVFSILRNYKKELENQEFEIIVGDNGSKDGSLKVLEELKKDVPGLLIFDNKENLGFSKGHNILSKKAKGKYLLFLNSDTNILDGGIKSMVEFLDTHERIGVLGAGLKNQDGSFQKSAGKNFNLFNTLMTLLLGDSFVRFHPKEIGRVDWVSGASLMIRKSLFEKLGGYDEKFFMYVEDADLCLRVKKAGYEVFFYPDVNIEHMGEGSSDRTFAILNIYKGFNYFFKKHGNSFSRLAVRAALTKKAIIVLIVGKLTGNKYLSKTYTLALKEVL